MAVGDNNSFVPQVVLAALQVAGERYEDETDEEYSTRVLKNALGITAMMSPYSWVGKTILAMQDPKGVLVGEIISKEFIEKQQRWLFTVKSHKGSKFSQDGLDRIKTDRIDSSTGLLVEDMVKQFKKGDVVRIWKKREEASETSDGMAHTNILYMEKIR